MAVMMLAIAMPAWAQPARTIHVLAPDNDYAYQFDPMISEAAARLVTAELVVRHGQPARFWPVDRLADLPEDAWPRIVLSSKEYKGATHFRLRRQGNTFRLFASQNGQDYIEFARWTAPLKPELQVGIMLQADWKNRQDGSATFQDVRFNGKPVTEFEQAAIGRCFKDSTFRHEGDKWICQQSGYDWQGWDVREHGQFLYQTVKGDFELQAKTTDFSTRDPFFNALILCREGLDLDSASLGISSCGWRFDGFWRRARDARAFMMNDFGMHVVTARLQISAKEEPVVLCCLPVSQPSWEALTNSAKSLADAILDGLGKELKVDLSKPANAGRLDEKTNASLGDALQQAAGLNSSRMLEASRQIDAVLSKSPLAPEGHHAVTMFGSILASEDLTGVFSERGRFLGGLLSHQLLAGRLAKEQSDQGRLSEAWLAMVSGYPKAAMEIYQGIPSERRNEPELLALKIFADLDYTVLTADAVTDAAPLVQLAWMRAVQECDQTRLLGRIPVKLSRDAQSPALLPLHIVNPHGAMAARSAFAHDAYDLLRNSQINLKERTKAAKALAGFLELEKSDDLYVVAENVYSILTNEDSDIQLDENAFKPLCDLYLQALQSPVGPERLSTGELRWAGISLHDYADLQRGLLLRTIYRQGDELGTEEYYLSAARSFSSVPGAADFFELKSMIPDRKPQLKDKLAAFLKTRPARSAALMRWLWAGNRLPMSLTLPPGRGSWDWGALAWMNLYNDIYHAGPCALAALENDFGSEHSIEVLTFLCKDPGFAKPYLDLMPYNTLLLNDFAYRASELKREDVALEAYRKLLDVDEQWMHYRNLAVTYNNLNRLDDAVDVIKKAEERLKNDIGVADLQGMATQWLVKAGRMGEALDMGRKALAGGTWLGMQGCAAAYDANEMVDEAMTIYRDAARAYPASSAPWFRFLVKRAYDQQDVIDQVKVLISQNEKVAHLVKDQVLQGFREAGGNYALLEKVLAGPLSGLDESVKARQLLLNAILQRDFAKATEYSERLQKAGGLNVEEAVWSTVAYRMAGKDLPESLRSVLEKCPEKHDLAICARYCLGQITAISLPAKSYKRAIEVDISWLRGVEAELKKDKAAALASYQKAAEDRGYVEADLFCKVWAEALDKASSLPAKATSQAAGGR